MIAINLCISCVLTTFFIDNDDDDDGLPANLIFDILNSKSNQFNFVPNCTEVVNLV